jgi:hypothetical protein
MYGAKIENGVVTDVIIVGDGNTPPVGFTYTNTKVGVGWSYDGQVFAAPPPEPIPVIVPAEISKIQLVRACRELDIWDGYKALFEADPDWQYITQIPRNDQVLNANANGLLGEETAQALLDQIFILGITK